MSKQKLFTDILNIKTKLQDSGIMQIMLNDTRHSIIQKYHEAIEKEKNDQDKKKRSKRKSPDRALTANALSLMDQEFNDTRISRKVESGPLKELPAAVIEHDDIFECNLEEEDSMFLRSQNSKTEIKDVAKSLEMSKGRLNRKVSQDGSERRRREEFKMDVEKELNGSDKEQGEITDTGPNIPESVYKPKQGKIIQDEEADKTLSTRIIIPLTDFDDEYLKRKQAETNRNSKSSGSLQSKGNMAKQGQLSGSPYSEGSKQQTSNFVKNLVENFNKEDVKKKDKPSLFYSKVKDIMKQYDKDLQILSNIQANNLKANKSFALLKDVKANVRTIIDVSG